MSTLSRFPENMPVHETKTTIIDGEEVAYDAIGEDTPDSREYYIKDGYEKVGREVLQDVLDRRTGVPKNHVQIYWKKKREAIESGNIDEGMLEGG